MTVIKKLVDLSLIYLRIYPHHFNMIGDHPFGMMGWPSFRNDGELFGMTVPASAFRNQGGVTSCHNENYYHFFYHK